MNQADLIVVGAGSAGCLLASRLAHQHGFRVTLVEPPSLEAPRIDRIRPARWLNLLGSSEDWDLVTAPSVALARRQLQWPRGRGMGGSSRINAMIWFPPTPVDRRMLVEASGGQWSEEQLVQAYESTRALVKPEQPRWLSEASTRFMQAVGEAPDASPMVYQRMNRRGRRWNPAQLIDDGRSGTAVNVVRGTVDRLILDGDRARGVHVVHGSTQCELQSTSGVVLCAGTIATPTILMRSGIGPRDQLAHCGIDVRIESPSVGEHLQDHLIMPVIFRTEFKNAIRTQPSVRDIARWQMLGNGPIGSNVAECGGLFDNDTIQIHVTPTHYLTFPRQRSGTWMTIGVNVTQPASRGSVQVESRDCDKSPTIHAGYLNRQSDLADTVRAVRRARRLVNETRLASWITQEDIPGATRDSDEKIAKSISRYAQTLYHPVGTCRMGSQSDAVVNSNLAVRNTERLWVADASILPKLTIGNPSATVMSLAWMAAEIVAQQTRSSA